MCVACAAAWPGARRADTALAGWRVPRDRCPAAYGAGQPGHHARSSLAFGIIVRQGRHDELWHFRADDLPRVAGRRTVHASCRSSAAVTGTSLANARAHATRTLLGGIARVDCRPRTGTVLA